MSSRLQRAAERAQNVSDEHDLFDDSTGKTPAGSRETHLRLRDRFLDRLSTIAAAIATLGEQESPGSLDIYLSRNVGSPQRQIELDTELRVFLDNVEQSLSTIATHLDGSRCLAAEDDLWDSVLQYAYLHIDHIPDSMKRAFTDNHDTFADLVIRCCGLDAVDEKGSKVDRILGDLLISLRHKTDSYDRSMAQLNKLVRFAFNMARDVEHLRTRLRCILRKTRFADELYNLICTLGFPKRAFDTFVRAAKTRRAFSKVTFHLTPASTSPRKARPTMPSAQSSAKVKGSPSKSANTNPVARPPAASIAAVSPSSPASAGSSFASSLSSLPTKASGTPSRSLEPQTQGPNEDKKRPTTTERDLMAAIQPYLAAEDQSIRLEFLQPASKQETAHLALAVLRDCLLPTSCNAWYSFGFATTKCEEEERKLGGLYAAILKEAQIPRTIFREMMRALETNTLVTLFDIEKFSHFREDFPRLETFLRTPNEKRWTVWHLVQYLRIERYTEPAPVLKRDYGYQFCKNHDEVTLLNSIYSSIIAKINPEELHNACRYGRISEFVQEVGKWVEPKNRRLLKNDYGYPGIGFDNDQGLERHRLPLFKRSLKN